MRAGKARPWEAPRLARIARPLAPLEKAPGYAAPD